MAVQDLPIVGDSFNVGFRFQRYWDTPMANAFFACEFGAGFFLVSLLIGFVPGMIAGLAVGVALKTYFHLSHMGVPMKSWRAIIRPDRSWISRGLLGIVFFVGFGIAHIANVQLGLVAGWGLPEFVSDLVRFGAAAAAVVCMTYQGFAMSHSSAISLWSTGLMPVSSFVYSAASGTMLVLATGWGGFLANRPDTRQMMITAALLLCFGLVAVLISLLHASRHGSPGARKSFELLTKTLYAKWFYSMIWIVGIGVPVLILWLAPSQPTLIAAAAATLVGHYAFRLLIFKAGVFEPIMSFRP
jgi:formate-dependent nitrite reductase membrane component NrfD